MPIHKIQVSEYECVHCGYKWINRVNGQDKPLPKNCAKCKRFHWNGKGEGSGYNPISPRERGLRIKLYRYEGYYNIALGMGRQYRPNALCKKFLGLNPRPTMEELYSALYPLKYNFSKYRHNRYIRLIPDPNPNRPKIAGRINLRIDKSRWTKDPKTGETKYNHDPNFVDDWKKTLLEESRLRREFMIKVIESRGEKVPEDIPKLKIPYQLDNEKEEAIEPTTKRLVKSQNKPSK